MGCSPALGGAASGVVVASADVAAAARARAGRCGVWSSPRRAGCVAWWSPGCSGSPPARSATTRAVLDRPGPFVVAPARVEALAVPAGGGAASARCARLRAAPRLVAVPALAARSSTSLPAAAGPVARAEPPRLEGAARFEGVVRLDAAERLDAAAWLDPATPPEEAGASEAASRAVLSSSVGAGWSMSWGAGRAALVRVVAVRAGPEAAASAGPRADPDPPARRRGDFGSSPGNSSGFRGSSARAAAPADAPPRRGAGWLDEATRSDAAVRSVAAARSEDLRSGEDPLSAVGLGPAPSRELGRGRASTAPALVDGAPSVAAPDSGAGREFGSATRPDEIARPIGEIVAPGDSASPPPGSAGDGLPAPGAFAPARRAGRANGMIWASPGGGWPAAVTAHPPTGAGPTGRAGPAPL